MIKIQEVSKSFKITDGIVTPAIKNITVEFHAGTVNYIVGESGAGKSSLLKLITGDFYPSKGEVYIDGKSFDATNMYEVQALRQHVGIVYQNLPLISDLSAIENVMQPLLARGVALKEAYQRSKMMLETVGIFNDSGSHHEMLPQYLSSGQQQRVSVACAMVTNPSILIADEPTANVDDETARLIFQLFFDYVNSAPQQQRTVIIATHSHLISEFKAKIYRLSQGVLIESNEYEKF